MFANEVVVDDDDVFVRFVSTREENGLLSKSVVVLRREKRREVEKKCRQVARRLQRHKKTELTKSQPTQKKLEEDRKVETRNSGGKNLTR